ncbi:RICIN domain-containing protein [Streptomyces griseus]|uniref:RICIN domain-containing protein n=1 Tax=Streptomyces griseus TaxID=1911 RepID=UPI0004CC7E48|nr:RICIN domain-containing protein [Streptomyces griseus]
MEYKQPYGAVTVLSAECGADTAAGGYSWIYRANSDGSFRLVNKKSGKCLQPGPGIAVETAACTGTGSQSWKVFATTSSGRQFVNVGTGQCLTSNPGAAMSFMCGSASPSQLWRNIGAI